MGLLVLQSIWLALPVIAGGAVHIAFIKLGALESLARIPIDGGLTFRGRRLFGDHKTVRGIVVMVAAWIPPQGIVMLLVAITLTVHPAVAWAMMTLGLKKRVG